MVCDRRKFPRAEMLPLTREEMISLLKGNGTPRVGVACGNWLHIDELSFISSSISSKNPSQR